MNTHRVLVRISVALVLLSALLAPAPYAQAPITVSAQQIDQYLGSKHITNAQGTVVTPPLTGLGSVFIQDGSQYSVDPRLIVAISGAESSFGVHICSTNNAWNWFWNGPCPNSPFDSWNSGIMTLSHFMEKSYILHGYNTVSLIGARYCAPPCTPWVPNVTQFMTDMGGDPNSLTWNGSGAGSGTTSGGTTGGSTDGSTGSTTGGTTDGSTGGSTGGTTSGSNDGSNGGSTDGSNSGSTGGVTGGSNSDGTTSSGGGSDDLSSTPEQVLAPTITVQPAGLFGSTKVNVTAEVLGQSLIANSVQVWQELPNQGEAMLAQLTASGPGTLGGTNYGGTVTVQGALPAQIWVTASFQDGSFVHLTSSSTAAIQGSGSSGSGLTLAIIFAVVVLLIVGVVILVVIRRNRKKQPV